MWTFDVHRTQFNHPISCHLPAMILQPATLQRYCRNTNLRLHVVNSLRSRYKVLDNSGFDPICMNWLGRQIDRSASPLYYQHCNCNQPRKRERLNIQQKSSHEIWQIITNQSLFPVIFIGVLYYWTADAMRFGLNQLNPMTNFGEVSSTAAHLLNFFDIRYVLEFIVPVLNRADDCLLNRVKVWLWSEYREILTSRFKFCCSSTWIVFHLTIQTITQRHHFEFIIPQLRIQFPKLEQNKSQFSIMIWSFILTIEPMSEAVLSKMCPVLPSACSLRNLLWWSKNNCLISSVIGIYLASRQFDTNFYQRENGIEF